MNEDYSEQQRRNFDGKGDDSGTPKPSRRLPEPRNVDDLLDRVDEALDSNLHREYRQTGGE
jgi:hypothetical protein